MLADKNKDIGKACEVLKTLSADSETWAQYLDREKVIKDYNARILFAKNEGKEEKALEIAKKLITTGMPFTSISEITELMEGEIKNFKNRRIPLHDK